MITYILDNNNSGKIEYITKFLNKSNAFVLSINEIRINYCQQNNINYEDLFLSNDSKITIINKQIEKTFNELFDLIPNYIKQGKKVYIDHEKYLFDDNILITNKLLKLKKEPNLIFINQDKNYYNYDNYQIKKDINNSILLKYQNNVINIFDYFSKSNSIYIDEFNLYFLDSILNQLKYHFKPSSNNLQSKFKELIIDNILFNKGYDNILNTLDILSDKNLSFNSFLNKLSSKYLHNIINFINIYYKDHLLFKNYSNLDKNNQYYFNIMNFQCNTSDLSEKLFDNYYKIKEHSNILKFSKSFLRSYKHLLNDTSFELFRELYKQKISRDEISNGLRKIASFKDSNYLINALNKIIDNNRLTSDSILKKCNNENLSIENIYNKDNILVLRINDFKASKSLGSSQWCISYDEDLFYSYLESEHFKDNNNHGSHYFVWDFNRPYHDTLRQVGITLDFGQNIIASHDINDNSINIKDIFNNDFINILKDDYNNNVFDIYADFSSTDYATLLSDTKDYSDSLPYPLYILENSTNTDNLIFDTNENYFNISKYIVKKTIDDHFKYNLISNKEVFNSIISFSETISELIKNNDPDTFFCDYNNQFDVFNSDVFTFLNSIPELDKLDILNDNKNLFSLIFSNSFNLYSSKKKVIEKEIINFYFNNDFILSNLEKRVLFIQYSNKFNDDNINNKIIPFFESYLSTTNELPLFLLESKNDKILNLFIDNINKNDFFSKRINLKNIEIQTIKEKLFNSLSYKNQKQFLNLLNDNKKSNLKISF